MIKQQTTLHASTSWSGVSLHEGRNVSVVVRPAPAFTGLVFIRTDISDIPNLIPVHPYHVHRVRNCTGLRNYAGVEVITIEHLMAALSALSIDNAYIEVNGKELPVMDGSSEVYLRQIEKVGLVRQMATRQYMKIIKPVEYQQNESHIRIEPAETYELNVEIDFVQPAIGKQTLSIKPDLCNFREHIASARTFVCTNELVLLQQAGLSKGGMLENAIIVDGDTILNPGGLRFENEFVAHKTLDLMGDLYLVGPLLGRVHAKRCGHKINHSFLLHLLTQKQTWTYVGAPVERSA